ncbi:MAG TPA: ribonuclease domain-containing protein [Flavobacteriaceae bacterium]|nr:ribonuclease domain-containing protein [Flavobacteriaceae bacterium]
MILILGIIYLQDNNKEVVKERKSANDKEQVSNSKHQIDQLTDETVVVNYFKTHGELPEYYLTKNQAKQKGWVPVKGNLCEVLPGKAIGGDRFGNREGLLPNKTGRQFYEADLNYNCGKRNADRLVYSNDGLIYVTKDHYKSFQKQ